MKNMLGINWYRLNYNDLQACFEIVCFILGIGSLTVAYAMAQAGPIFGSIAFILMVFFNIYCTVLISKCFLRAPKSVDTFSDLGFFVAGIWGRRIVQITQFSTCFLVPIAVLILGGQTLLPIIFGQNMFPQWVWITFMAIALLPVVLIQSLKEAFIIMVIGAGGAFFADFTALGNSLITVSYEYFEPTQVEFWNIIPVFGSFALAYATAIILPTVQRGHPEPERMPANIVIGVGLVSIIYALIAGLGYYQYGCSSPKNLLTAMDESIWRRIASFLMLIHVMIAFAMIANPILYYLEKNVLNFHKLNKPLNDTNNDKQILALTPVMDKKSTNYDNMQDNLEKNVDSIHSEQDLVDIKYTGITKIKSMIIRSSIVIIQAILAIGGRESFAEVTDFIGATTITVLCLVLPCIFYMKLYKKEISRIETIICTFIILVSIFCGIYTAYNRLKSIIDTVRFKNNIDFTQNKYPFCKEGYQIRKARIIEF